LITKEAQVQAQINLVELQLENLGQLLDGAVVRQVQRLIEDAYDDMERRPSESKQRTVSIVLRFTPKVRIEQIDERTKREVFDGANLVFDMNVSIPKRSTMSIDLGLGGDRALVFNPHCHYDVRQAPLPFIDGEARETVPMASGA
jgi:hypothetical protein